MTEKAKLETVLEDPELPATQSKKSEILTEDKQNQEKTTKTVVVDIQLPIVTEISSIESSRENSAVRDQLTKQEAGKGRDENNIQDPFLDKLTEKLEAGDPNDDLYRAFTRTDTMISKASSIALPSPKRQSARKGKTQKIPRSKSSKGFTKKELEIFLPRKTYFSAHDKELREAGYQVDNSEQRQKPNWRAILRMHTMDELYPPNKEPEEKTFGLNVENESDDEEDGDQFLMEKVDTAMSSGVDVPAPKQKKSKKKQISNEKEEYKPLYEYLKYIQEHSDEYKTMSKYTPKNNDYRHPNNMVRLGRVFRRWHHGTQKYSIYQHALNGLKTTPEVENKRGQVPRRESQDPGDQTPAQEESEIEKLKNKTEKWFCSLSTQQQLRVRELALKDVGDEDVTMSKWWVTFRSCHYIRLPQHLSTI